MPPIRVNTAQPTPASAPPQPGAFHSRMMAPRTRAGKVATTPYRAVSKTNTLVGAWGARHGMGGPTGRLAQLEAGYQRSLAYTQPGARGLINALQGSFGAAQDEVMDPFTRENIAWQMSVPRGN